MHQAISPCPAEYGDLHARIVKVTVMKETGKLVTTYRGLLFLLFILFSVCILGHRLPNLQIYHYCSNSLRIALLIFLTNAGPS